MNVFEKELCKLFGSYDGLTNTTFVGSACYGNVGPDLKAKIQFVSMGIHNQFEALRITILNRTDGQVDSVVMRFSDLLGKKRTAGFPEGMYPYIWKYRDEAKWYAYHPTPADYKIIRETAASYLDVFRQPVPEISTAPKQRKTAKSRDQSR